MSILSIDDVFAMADANLLGGELPQVGEVWKCVNGDLVEVRSILSGMAGIVVEPVDAVDHPGWQRTRDGRAVIFGGPLSDPHNLAERVSAPN